ncbi:hypothetical protein ACRRTK_014794 [Alexandromys fortis]
MLKKVWIPSAAWAEGFIDFVVEPTFTVLTDMTEKIVSPLIDETSQSGGTSQRRSRSTDQYTSVVQKALVPDSAHGQAFDQSSYEKGG